jgi:AcrR family transcriptional regulator
MTHEAIAAAIGISPPTLRKHFADELSAVASKRRLEVLTKMFRTAMKGNVSAQKAFLAAGDAANSAPPPAPKPEGEKVGKKERAEDSTRRRRRPEPSGVTCCARCSDARPVLPRLGGRLRERRSLVPQLVLPDPELGDRAVAAFNKLRLADVPGTPTMAEAGGDWFRDIVRRSSGARSRPRRRRLIRELFCLVPKKNSKTTNGALLMLTALLLNERPRAPMALMAPVQDTAERGVRRRRRRDRAGSGARQEVPRPRPPEDDRAPRDEGGPADHDLRPGRAHGEEVRDRPLIDELHVIAKNAKAADAMRQVRGGMLPFPEGFLAFITTMPDKAPVGVMKAELGKARAIRDGRQTGKMLPVLYEFPREMQLDQRSRGWTRRPGRW